MVAAIPSADTYGQGTGLILMDNVNCQGIEERLDQCNHRGWTVHNCDHSNDAAAECYVERASK